MGYGQVCVPSLYHSRRDFSINEPTSVNMDELRELSITLSMPKRRLQRVLSWLSVCILPDGGLDLVLDPTSHHPHSGVLCPGTAGCAWGGGESRYC